jgi:lipoate-protein ligase B
MNYVLDRLREDSTWRGLLMCGTALGVHLDPSQANAIIACGLALIGLINVFRKQQQAK